MQHKKEEFLLLYDISICIDTSLDIVKLKKQFFLTLLKKLNCNALVFFDKNLSQYESLPKPYLKNSNIGHIIRSKWNESTTYVQWGTNKKYHILNIPDLGFIFLDKTGEAIPDLILNMLYPILAKFSLAYSACLQQKKLKAAKDEAEKVSQVKSTFLAVVSHEIRTPLNGVIGMLDLLSETKLSAEQQNYINKMKYSSETLLVLLNDILDYTTIGSTNINFDYRSTNIREFINNCVELIRSSYNQSQNTIMVSIDEKIPDEVIIERSRLGQVLFNLISNSCKFTEKGKITIEVSKKDSGVQYSIRDTGIGIAKKRVQEIFEPFNQENLSKTRTHTGTGLGLPICKKLINLMDSYLYLETAEGAGAHFYFTLQDRQNSSDISMTKKVNHKKEKVLVAEDNEINRELLVTILKKMNVKSDIACNGQEAVDKCHQNNGYDLIFMDMRMPILDGIGASREILSQFPKTKIIAISANTSEEDISKFYDVGIEEFIGKPYKISRIKEAIERNLTKKERAS